MKKSLTQNQKNNNFTFFNKNCPETSLSSDITFNPSQMRGFCKSQQLITQFSPQKNTAHVFLRILTICFKEQDH